MSDSNRAINAELFNDRLLYLVKNNDPDEVKNLMDKAVRANVKVDFNVKDDYEMAPLHLATKECYVKMAEVLLGGDGIDVNIKNADGWTPLHFAADKNCKEIAEALLEKDGIDVNIKNANGWTPLHSAAINNCKEIAEVLLGKDGIDVNIQADGWTPLHFAAINNCKEVAEALLGKDGIDVNIKDADGWTPLHSATMSNRKEVAEALLGKDGIDVNIKNADGWTPLHFAADKNCKEIAEALLEKDGIDVNIKNADGWTPFDLVENEEIKTLLKKAAEKADESLVHEPSTDNEGGLEEDVGQEGNVQPVIQEQDPEEESQEISAEEGNDVKIEAVKPDNGRSTDTAPTQNDVSLRSESSTSEEQPSSFFGSLFSILTTPFSLIASFFSGFFLWLFSSNGENADESNSQSDVSLLTSNSLDDDSLRYNEHGFLE